ncbi:MAG: cysteine peptidase family C39 domain-containing protein [Patescibacteria group bacterium]|nr:cysteine peptidase family C39 domain-containing protein [Patescibacteria group bacterium]
MKLLKVKHFRQTPGMCGPYSLKILLSFFGKDEKINKLIRHCKASAKYGAEHEDLVKTAKQLGAKVSVKTAATDKDLDYWVNKKHLPVIIGWFSEYSDHYSVVVGLDKTHIYLCNPEENRAIHKLKKEFFNEVWFHFVGKKNEKIVWRWLMAITEIK